MTENHNGRLLWLDLEMTGLDPKADDIVEAGAIVTDFSLKELETYEAIIHLPKKSIEKMKSAPWYDWTSGSPVQSGSVFDMHERNGLINQITASKVNTAAVERALILLIRKHFADKAIIAGNSIHQDRRFIRAKWPKLEELLHYRMLDVTSLKIWIEGTMKLKYKKPDAHRALEDVRSSIKEFQFYITQLKK